MFQAVRVIKQTAIYCFQRGCSFHCAVSGGGKDESRVNRAILKDLPKYKNAKFEIQNETDIVGDEQES